MHLPSKIVKELTYVNRFFAERFRPFLGRRIALYPGECLEEILRTYDPLFHFHCVLEAGCAEVPPNAELVILTNFRGVNETDYACIHASCERAGVPLCDLFGLDLIQLHRDLEEQEYLTVSQWKDLLSDYDAVSLPVAWAAADYSDASDRWVIRRRFQILYNWMISRGKTVVFLWEDEKQLDFLRSERLDVRGTLIRRQGKNRGFLQLLEQVGEKRILHVGTDPVKDGIVPREYGIDSRLIRYYAFTGEVKAAGAGRSSWADIAQLRAAIDGHDVISFDLFDTLLKRIVLFPRDVFEMAEEQTGVKGFADCRYRIQTSCPRLSLDGIYARLKEACGYSDETIERLRSTELQLETKLILPRRKVLELFEYAKERGKTVILVSDMYLDPSFLKGILEKLGITGYEALYVSCRYGCLKHEGLFEEVLKRTEGRTVLHIGDDLFSDFACAKEFGLDAFHVPSCLDTAKRNGYEKASDLCRTLADRKLLGLAVASAFDDPFAAPSDAGIACMVVAPLILGYLQWVGSKLAEKAYDRFLLASRDGWILLNAYEKLRERLPERGLPPAAYFYTSRRAAFLCVMDDPEAVKQYVRLSDHDPDPPALLRRQFGLSDEELLPYRGESAESYLAMHSAVIHEAAERHRRNYRAYLEQAGLFGKRCAMMDFVSEGSCQLMLEKQVTGVMDGYYVGIPEYVSRYAPNIQYYLDQDLMDYNTEMQIEVYFTSMEPALERIGENGQPVLAGENRDRRILDRTKTVHGLARIWLDAYLDRLYDPGEDLSVDLIRELCTSIRFFPADNLYYDDLSGQEIRTEG